MDKALQSMISKVPEKTGKSLDKWKTLSKAFILSLIVLFAAGCNRQQPEGEGEELTIFFFNDFHAQLENFAKIKYIIDLERQETNVIVASAGDAFSGNPVVDFYAEKGFPVIDMMNKVGVDVSALGNHEFDYGQDVLAARIDQSEFPWLCANVDMGSSVIPQPSAYTTLSTGDLEISFFSVVETGGNQEGTIPSTHPLKVDGITFDRPENVIAEYEHVKESEEADLYIALTHLGSDGHGEDLGDFQLAQQFPYFDLIIGGHSHEFIDTEVNGIPVFQASAYLNYLGKIELLVHEKEITSLSYTLIDLNKFDETDATLLADIEAYNTTMTESLEEVIGYAEGFHEKYLLGCFYTDAIRERMDVDVTFQNPGGIRADLDDGNITIGEIYEIDPFNNGTMKYLLTVEEIKDLFIESGMRLYYSGIQMQQKGEEIEIRSMDGKILADTTHLSVGINDYLPATNAAFFPADGEKMPYTTAEAIIYYLQNIKSEVSYSSCSRSFRYEN